jgi:biotin carboxylase
VLLLLSGSRRIVDKTRGLGLDVVQLQAPSMAHPELAELCRHTERIDFLDTAATVRLARKLHERFGFAGVLSNHEPASVAAEQIALDLGLRAPGKHVAAILRDKVATRQALDGDASLRTAWTEVTSVHDIATFGASSGFPLILKPRDGSASIGVIRVDAPAEVEGAWARARAALGNQHRFHEVLPVTGYLAEPFFAGAEYSVETFTRDGRHEVCALVGKSIDAAFVEIGHVVPAAVTEGQRAEIVEKVTGLLDAVGLREGPAHTEVIVGAAGVHLIESHARTGGDEIPALARLVTGWDIEAGMIAHFTGLPVPATVAPVAPAAAKVYLTAPAAGRIVSIGGIERALAVEGVQSAVMWAGEGDAVGLAGASWDRLGEVVAVGDTPTAARNTAARAAELIGIEWERT